MEGEGVKFTGIQLLICATKWDKIQTLPAPSKAVLAKALRCVAHAHGCHLIYTTSLTQAQGNGQKPQEMQRKLRTLFAHMMFTGFERQLCAAQLMLHERVSVTSSLCLCTLRSRQCAVWILFLTHLGDVA